MTPPESLIPVIYLHIDLYLCSVHFIFSNKDSLRSRQALSWVLGCNEGAKRKSLVSIGFSLSVNQFIPNCPGLYICGEVPLI